MLTGALSSQGHSALRDPERSVFASFPEADGYRVIVRPVGKEVRAEVQERIPFSIHFNELGNHAVYAALRGRRPLGLIHARTEEGKWGLIEIEWALDLDLVIRDFKLHRCRSRYREAVEQSEFAKSLIGRDVRQLSRLIDDKGRVNPKAGAIPPGGERLAETVIKSAIKTLILTDSAWRSDIARLRDLDLGLRAFPEGTIRRLLPPKEAVLRSTSKIRSLRALLVRDDRGRRLGRVLSTQVAFGSGTMEVEWILDTDGRVRQIDAPRGWPDARTRLEFKRLEGRRVESVEPPTKETEQIAAELTTIVATLKEPGVK